MILILLFSFTLVLIEKVYQALETVFDQNFQALVKNALLHVVFSPLFLVFENVFKLCLKFMFDVLREHWQLKRRRLFR